MWSKDFKLINLYNNSKADSEDLKSLKVFSIRVIVLSYIFFFSLLYLFNNWLKSF